MHWPDFLASAAQSYWTDQLAKFHAMVPFDGIWIDMNEPSNFCTGDICTLDGPVTRPSPGEVLVIYCTAFPLIGSAPTALDDLNAPQVTQSCLLHEGPVTRFIRSGRGASDLPLTKR